MIQIIFDPTHRRPRYSDKVRDAVSGVSGPWTVEGVVHEGRYYGLSLSGVDKSDISQSDIDSLCSALESHFGGTVDHYETR